MCVCVGIGRGVFAVEGVSGFRWKLLVLLAKWLAWESAQKASAIENVCVGNEGAVLCNYEQNMRSERQGGKATRNFHDEK